VRDAANGQLFAARVRERYGLEARTLTGAEEARLTFAGATATRDAAAPVPVVVVDIGGGSTEVVVGEHGRVDFFVSLQVGVVRHSERHIASDPPAQEEIARLRAAVAAELAGSVPAELRAAVRAGVAVAGTPTSAAAIELGLVPYRARAVEGHVLSVATLARQLDGLASIGLRDRRRVRGLHPDRAPTIVAGLAILLEVLATFGLTEVTVSDRDILWGAALGAA
jgi:exopolyphosphatase/guanosine-5'-triphosphate,3'-diphosphate pyrophosphatase